MGVLISKKTEPQWELDSIRVLRTFMWAILSRILSIAHNWNNNIILYKRYIDDLVFIWKGSQQDFKFFVS